MKAKYKVGDFVYLKKQPFTSGWYVIAKVNPSKFISPVDPFLYSLNAYGMHTTAMEGYRFTYKDIHRTYQGPFTPPPDAKFQPGQLVYYGAYAGDNIWIVDSVERTLRAGSHWYHISHPRHSDTYASDADLDLYSPPQVYPTTAKQIAELIEDSE